MSKKAKKVSPLKWIIALSALFILGYFINRRSFVQPCANTLSCKESLDFLVDNTDLAVFNGNNLEPPKIVDLTPDTKVLGSESSLGEKHIYVDLTTQTLKAYDGDTLFMETKIASGKWFPTPTGDFTIWEKVRATKMSGGEGADYYYLPNVPFVMFFSNSKISAGRGFSLHGTYWHDNFGHAMSHGCVNMRTIDAQKLYEWATPINDGNTTLATVENPGTKITIYGQAP
jgi:hypothetical protein